MDGWMWVGGCVMLSILCWCITADLYLFSIMCRVLCILLNCMFVY